MNSDFTILVNSTDSFEDCWRPFFKLFSKFWPECREQIILNTETKEYAYAGLDIACSMVSARIPSKKLSWGECLLRCLDKIKTEIVLYLQDDYFINGPVDVGQIEDFVQLMNNEGNSNIRLLECANAGPWHPSDHPLLWKVDQRALYRISLQASLWRKDRLGFYVRKHENPWQFEIWGSKRAHRVRDTIYCVNRDIFNKHTRQVIPYIPTGVIKGKWNKEAVYDLFLENGIEMDFSQRGFYDSNQKSARKAPFVTKIISRLRSAF